MTTNANTIDKDKLQNIIDYPTEDMLLGKPALGMGRIGKKITPDEWRRIVSAFVGGTPINVLATVANVTLSTEILRTRLSYAGLYTKRFLAPKIARGSSKPTTTKRSRSGPAPALSDAKVREAYALHRDQRMTLNEIVAALGLGISKRTLAKSFRRLGLETFTYTRAKNRTVMAAAPSSADIVVRPIEPTVTEPKAAPRDVTTEISDALRTAELAIRSLAPIQRKAAAEFLAKAFG